MSSKLKFSSNSSTPAKIKPSSASASPAKSNKYKNFLTSVLTPQSRKWMRRKKSIQSEDSFTVPKSKDEDPQVFEDFNEPGYSSIQDLQLKHSYTVKSDLKSLFLSAKPTDYDQDSSNYDCQEEKEVLSIAEEPVYAHVNKQKKKKERARDSGAIQRPEQESSETNVFQHPPIRVMQEELPSRDIVQEQKEEIQLLVERLREVTKENRELHKNMETILREQKWKEDSLHAELKLKVSELEVDTHKEVNCLSEQIKTLLKERKVLTDQVDIMHEEKKLLQAEHEAVCRKAKTLVSPEFLKQTVENHQKLLSSLKKKHHEEVKYLQQENERVLSSKDSLSGEAEELQQKVQTLMVENERLRNSEQQLGQEKSRILLQLEESRKIQQEAQSIMLSLLKMTEDIAVERDILLSKSSYQDEQQHLLKASMMDYSVNLGRLQEHISNLSKEKLEELQKLRSSESARDETVRNVYGRHLELLRSKVLNQSNTISNLETEKSKLEVQLESLWQAACLGKPKLLEDIKYNL